tara:strand:- start:81 stop:521 length:441 start_codon:yes stop_codon:yes gene_type:complete
MRNVTVTNTDGTTEEVVRFEGTIRSISGEAVEFGNKGKIFYRATVEFTDIKGNATVMGARIYGGNVTKADEEGTPMQVGDKRMCTMQTYQDAEGKDRYSITISHLRYTELVSFDEAMEIFGMTLESPKAVETSGTLEVVKTDERVS